MPRPGARPPACPVRAEPAGPTIPRYHQRMSSDAAQYDADEQKAIRDVLASGGTPECPRCGVAMTQRAIGGGSFGLGYARKREWLMCPKCRRSAMFDLKRGTRN
jgi:hypothetical protein